MSQTDEPIKLDAVQNLILRIMRRVQVGHIMEPGWSAPLPLYVFRCPTHGLVKGYSHGYKSHLACPRCLEELRKTNQEAEE